MSAGEAGYQPWLASAIAGCGTAPDADGNYTTCTGSARGLDQEGAELMGRNVWFVWNLDDVADGSIDAFSGEDVDGDGVGDNTGMEKGSVLRIITNKTNQLTDEFVIDTKTLKPATTDPKEDVNTP